MTWLTNLLLRALDHDERIAVEGDLAESGETASQAFRQVLGLAVRREAAPWKSWYPWASVAAAIPAARWLSDSSRYAADHTSIYLWMYVNNWVGEYVTNYGARADLFHFAAEIALGLAMLAAYSAMIGVVLGYLSGRAFRTVAAAFCILLAAWPFLLTGAAASRHQPNAVVFALKQYSLLLPLLVQSVLVLLPTVWGMRLARRFPPSRFTSPGALRICCVFAIVLGARAADAPGVRAAIEPAAARQAAPAIALQDSHGKILKLDQYRGKVVLLDFWATWCHGCKEEIPWFEQFDKRYKDKGLAVVGISLDGDGWKVLRPFLKNTMKIPYRIALGDDATAALFKIENMPDTFLIDRQGRIAASYRGLVDRDDIEKNVQAMLAAK